MTGTRIDTTRSQDVQALVIGGMSVVDAWSTLSALLTSQLSSDHAALLAEPVPNPARGETDWYAEGPGKVTRLAELPPDERAAANAVFQQRRADITQLAERLKLSRTPNERPLGELLGLAVSVPGDRYIFVQGQRPILVAWGHAPAGPAAEIREIRGETRPEAQRMGILPAPAPALIGPVSRRIRWPWFLLAAAFSLLLLAALIVVRDPLSWFDIAVPACQVPQTDLASLAMLRQQAEQGNALRQQLADLTNDAARRRLMCRPPALPSAPAATPGDVRRTQERGGHTGKLQVILAWDDRSDLDLHVICPSGQQIQHDHKSACGGHLDIDANAAAPQAINTPVENVYFDDPAPGRYRVAVDPYEIRPIGTPQTAFRVTIHREGREDQVIQGVAHAGQRNRVVTEIEIPAP